MSNCDSHKPSLPAAGVLGVPCPCGVVGCGVLSSGLLPVTFLEEDHRSSAMKLLGVGNPFPVGTCELLQLQLLTKILYSMSLGTSAFILFHSLKG